jgi:hypothetical protein
VRSSFNIWNSLIPFIPKIISITFNVIIHQIFVGQRRVQLSINVLSPTIMFKPEERCERILVYKLCQVTLTSGVPFTPKIIISITFNLVVHQLFMCWTRLWLIIDAINPTIGSKLITLWTLINVGWP